MKNLFGKVGEGIHSVRIYNVAVIDVLLTFLAGISLALWLKVNVILVTLLLFVSGIIIHRLFRVNTTVNKSIFGQV